MDPSSEENKPISTYTIPIFYYKSVENNEASHLTDTRAHTTFLAQARPLHDMEEYLCTSSSSRPQVGHSLEMGCITRACMDNQDVRTIPKVLSSMILSPSHCRDHDLIHDLLVHTYTHDPSKSPRPYLQHISRAE